MRYNRLYDIKILLTLVFFLNGVIYWFNLASELRYLINVWIVLVFLLQHKTSISAIKNKPLKLYILFFIIIIAQSLIVGWFNLRMVQACLGYIFLLFFFVIFFRINWNKESLLQIFIFFLVIYFIQIILATYQNLILQLPFDRVGGSLGRAETGGIAILSSMVGALGIGIYYYLNKKFIGIILLLSSSFFLIISEAKAGFIFLPIVSISLLLVPAKGIFNFRAVIAMILVIVIGYVSLFYILPAYFKLYYIRDFFYDRTSLFNYLGEDYSIRYNRLSAIYHVFPELLEKTYTFLFGYGFGSFSSTEFFDSTIFHPQIIYLYSMAPESVFYLIQHGIIGLIVFILINLKIFVMMVNIGINSNEKELKLLSSLSASISLLMIISFSVYSRPFRAQYLTLIYFGLVSITLKYNLLRMKN